MQANRPPLTSPWAVWLVSLGFALLILEIAACPGRNLLGRVLKWTLLRRIGRVSYFLYLFHLLVLQWSVALSRWFFPELPRRLLWTDTLVCIALLGVMAWVSWKWVEAPILRLAHRVPYPPPRTP